MPPFGEADSSTMVNTSSVSSLGSSACTTISSILVWSVTSTSRFTLISSLISSSSGTSTTWGCCTCGGGGGGISVGGTSIVSSNASIFLPFKSAIASSYVLCSKAITTSAIVKRRPTLR